MWLSVLKMARWGVCRLMNSCGKIINAPWPSLQPLPLCHSTACNICASQQPSCKPFPALQETTFRWAGTHSKGKAYKTLQKVSCSLPKTKMLSLYMREEWWELWDIPGSGVDGEGRWRWGQEDQWGKGFQSFLSGKVAEPASFWASPELLCQSPEERVGSSETSQWSHPGTTFKTMIRTAQATCRADTGHKHLVQSRSGVYFLHIRPGLMFHDPSSTSNIITLTEYWFYARNGSRRFW